MAKQSNYWNQRTLELQNSIALHEQALFQNLRQYYNTEATALERDIATYYSKYGTNNVIQYRNLLQSLSDADKQLLYEKIQDFEQKYPQYAHLMPVRESIYKLDRLEGLRTSVAIQQLKMGAYEIAQAQAHFQQMALLSGNFIAEQMGYGSSFYRIDSGMLRLVVGQDWCNNQDFSARIWHNRSVLTQTLQTQIVNGMIRGDSYKAISKSVQNKFQTVSQKNIERLVFTEDTFLANEAAMQTYLNDPDYAYYEYVAIGDGKTCDLCASLTGERFRISERRPGVNFPPMHPWCRCFFDIVYDKKSGNKDLTSGIKNAILTEGIPEYLKQKPKISPSAPSDPAFIVLQTNPNYWSGDRAYTINCQRCVIAYEARRRGYDVVAKPGKLGSDPLKGIWNEKGFPNVFQNGQDSLETVPGNTGLENKDHIENRMYEFGNGSRAIIRISFKESTKGHVFIAEQINNKTVFVDPQTGETNVGEKYFGKLPIAPTETMLLRIDDKDFTDLIRECIE